MLIMLCLHFVIAMCFLIAFFKIGEKMNLNLKKTIAYLGLGCASLSGLSFVSAMDPELPAQNNLYQAIMKTIPFWVMGEETLSKAGNVKNIIANATSTPNNTNLEGIALQFQNMKLFNSDFSEASWRSKADPIFKQYASSQIGGNKELQDQIKQLQQQVNGFSETHISFKRLKDYPGEYGLVGKEEYDALKA